MAKAFGYMGLAAALRAGRYVNLGNEYTTAPTTGLVKGDMMVLFNTSLPRIGVCTSTAAQTIKYIRLKTKSINRATYL